ncbi:CheR family methyltransferase, partial [Planctomycetota bacterium]
MTILTEDIRTFVLTDVQFNRIRRTVYDVCGINLHEGKKPLVQARLAKRLRTLGLKSFREYIRFVDEDGSNIEFSEMIDALTTNKTEFFREVHHFDLLKSTILPELKGRSLKVWSAGCSSGEEPYSLAIQLRECLGQEADACILATDISATILKKARQAVYRREAVGGVPIIGRERYFRMVPGDPDKRQVHADVRSMVRFARLNLKEAWP